MESTQNGHSGHTADAPIGIYKGKDLAAEFEIAGGTLSSRWYPWLVKVTDAGLLKANGRYTELAYTLFKSYKEQVKDQGIDAWIWVKTQKELLRQEVAETPYVEAELVPNEAETALATTGDTQDLRDSILEQFSNGNLALRDTAEQLIDGAVFSDTQSLEDLIAIEAMAGQREGLLLYAARVQARVSTIEELKREDLKGKQREAAT